jgi:predicted dienelactone hydrolase
MIPFPAGHTVLRTEDRARRRPILIDLWYPAVSTAKEMPYDDGLGRGCVAESADPLEGEHMAIVLSHGAFGAARNYSWIAAHLARQGYVVAGVSHFGESFVYGPETIDPAAALMPWLRSRDCIVALDYLLGESLFRHLIDPSGIGALGHSSGGATAISLAGPRYDFAAMMLYCTSGEASRDRGCDYARSRPQVSPPEDASRSYLDKRIRAIVAFDPALGPGYGADTLAEVSVPVLIVGAVENDFLPFEAHAGHYARLIPGAALVRLNGGEGHFVFLDECDSDRLANGVLLCRDREGVDRRKVHEYLKGVVTGFFKKLPG